VLPVHVMRIGYECCLRDDIVSTVSHSRRTLGTLGTIRF
jgi:hypothetical protein